jgi:tetratricopeptide (TPR) repeat protein/flagellar biosynthesis GTPase FlhF
MDTAKIPVKNLEAEPNSLLVHVATHYPFPIAYACQKINDEQDPPAQLIAIIAAYEQLVHYLGVLALAYCYRSDEKKSTPPSLTQLGGLQFDHWFEFVQQAAHIQTDSSSLWRKIAEALSRIEQNKGIHLQEISEQRAKKREIGHLANLHEVRQSLLTTFAVMNSDEQKMYAQYALTSLQKVLQELRFLPQYPLYHIENVAGEKGKVVARSLLGANLSSSNKVSLDNAQKLTPGQVWLWEPESKMFRPLHPWVVYQECYYCMREEKVNPWEFFCFFGRGVRRLYYTGSFHKIPLREPFQAYIQLQQNARVAIQEPSKSLKEIWERAFQITEATLHELKEAKILQNYYPRKEAEQVLDYFISQKTAPIFLLIGPKGVGKTVLLAQMARKWLSQGEVVFLWRVFNSRGVDLAKDLALALGGKAAWEEAMTVAGDTHKKWTIILDGAENSNSPEEFFLGLHNFAKQYRATCKIILALPETHYQFWQKYLANDLIMPVDGSCPILDSARPYFRLGQFARSELKDVYATLSANVGNIAPSFNSIPRHMRGMLRCPALAKIFLLSLRNREIPKYLGIRDALEGFVMNHISFCKERREFVDRFMEVVLKSRTLPITIEQLLDSDDTHLIKEILGFHAFNGLSALSAEGFLERYACKYLNDKDDTVLHFPSQILQDYLIYRTVALAGKHTDEMLGKYLSDLVNGNLTLWGVLYFALLRLIEKQYVERAVEIIKKTDQSHVAVAQLLYDLLLMKEQISSRTSGEDSTINALIQLLLNIRTPVVVMALNQFASYLYREENFKSAGALWERLSQNETTMDFPYQPVVFMILAGCSFQKAKDNKQASKLYKKSYKLLKKIENADKEAEVYNLLCTAHRELGDWERAESFLQKSLANQQKISGTAREADLYGELGHLAYHQGNKDKALQHFTRQKKILEDIGQEHKTGKSLASMAHILQQTGDKQQAIALLEDAVTLLRESGESREAAACQKNLAQLLADSGDARKAISTFINCLEIFESLDDQESLAESYLALGCVCREANKNDEAFRYFYKSLDILTELGNEAQMAYCYEQFGLLEMEQNRSEKAKEYFGKARGIYERRGDQAGIGNILFHLGMLHHKRGELSEAYNAYQESLKLRRAGNRKAGMAEACDKIAGVLAYRNDFVAALQILEESNKIYGELNDKRGLAHIKSTEALIYNLRGENTEALASYQECARMLEEIKDISALALIYNKMGLIYKERGNFYEALNYFEKSVKIQEEAQDWPGLATSYHNIGCIYDAKNEYEKALEYYAKNLKICKKVSDKLGMANAYNHIAILHYNHRNYARALWYLEKSLPFYEDLNDTEMIKKVKERIQHVREKL